MRFCKTVSLSYLIACLCIVSIAQFHHHGCSGDIHINCLSHCSATHSSDSSHHNHPKPSKPHHGHPCGKDCGIKLAKAVNEEISSKWIPSIHPLLFDIIHHFSLSYISGTAIIIRNNFNPCLPAVVSPHYGLRAPPVC